jgi:hypothetical protein
MKECIKNERMWQKERTYVTAKAVAQVSRLTDLVCRTCIHTKVGRHGGFSTSLWAILNFTPGPKGKRNP